MLPNIVFVAALFCGLFIWSPFLQGRLHRAAEERQQSAKRAEFEQEQKAQNASALNAIAQHGLIAFNEPINFVQESNLESYILSAHKFTPAELTDAAEHYQNPKIMHALAQNRYSPPEALEILYRNTAKKELEGPSVAGIVRGLYLAIAKNPNASTALLLNMLHSGNAGQRAAAISSGRLTSKQKIDYLEKGCTFTDGSEMIAVAEDPDTPVEILECLSAKPEAAVGVAANPHTPTNTLAQMSRSPDWRIANEGEIGLAQRNRNRK